MDINQSIDPSTIQDPNLRALVMQAQMQQGQQQPQAQPSPSGPANGAGTSSDVHPMTHVIAQAMFGGQPNQSNLQYVPTEVPGTGLGSMISKLFTGKPMMHAGNPVLATSQVPDQSGLPPGMQLAPIGTDAQGKPLYDYSSVQKQTGPEANYFAALMRNQANNPVLPPAFGQKLLTQDYDGAMKTLTDAGIPLTPHVQSLISNAKRGDQLSQALLGRVANQQTQQGVGLGEFLSAAKTSGDFKTQNDKTSNAIHGLQIVSQYYDPQTGDFKLPKNQYNEFAQTVAKIATNNPVLSNEQVDQINARTAKGDLAGVADYLGLTDSNGQRITGSTQSVINSMVDMLARQGITSQALRDTYIQSGLGAYQGLKNTNPGLYSAIVQQNYGSAPDFVGKLQNQPFANKYSDLLQGTQTIPPRPGVGASSPSPVRTPVPSNTPSGPKRKPLADIFGGK